MCPISIGSLNQDRKTLKIPFNNDEINLTYKPSVYTFSRQQDLEDQQNDRQGNAIADLLAEMITEWDILNSPDDPTPMEISSQNIAEMPTYFSALLWAAIMEDMAPDPEALRRSRNGSQRRVR